MKALAVLFLEELAVRYDSEQQQVEGLSKIAAAATCPHLQKLLLAHHGETENRRRWEKPISNSPPATGSATRSCNPPGSSGDYRVNAGPRG
ncbi:MAG TPA: hypothetical protein DDZ88_29755 [Verrucomicrobiales bacterium]|nr:hypothetical protein [Verrucomicrobiales bacterium]